LTVRFFLPLLFGLVLAGRAHAHDPGLSGATVTWQGDRLEAVVYFARSDIGSAVVTDQPAEKVSLDQLERLLPEVLMVETEGVLLDPTEKSVRFSGPAEVEFHLTFSTGTNAELHLRSPLIVRLPVGHRQFLVVTDAGGRKLTDRLLTATDDTMTVYRRSTDSGATPSFAGFLLLGIEHILTGYDHLLFLLALLIVTRDFRL